MIIEHQISIWEWFLKDHVTLEVMGAENFAFFLGINYILKCIQIENSYVKL